MECAEVREEFSALIDGELAPDARAAVEAHIAQCSDCLRDLDAIKRIDGSYRGLPPQPAPRGFEEGVRKALASAATARTRWWPRLAPVLAAAALVLVVLGTVTLREQRRQSVFTTASNIKEDSAREQKLSRQQSAAPDIAAETKDQLDGLRYVGAKTAPASPPAPVAEGLTTEAEVAPAPRALADKEVVREQAHSREKVAAQPPKRMSTIEAKGLMPRKPDASAAGAPSVAAGRSGRALAEPPSDAMRMRESDNRGIVSSLPPPVAPMPAPTPAPAATPPPPSPPPRAASHVEAYAIETAPQAVPPRAEMPVPARITDRHTGEAQAVQASPQPEPESAAQQYMTRGDALRDQGEIGRAVKNYQSAVELAPENVDALIKLGDALLTVCQTTTNREQDKKEDALRHFTEAVRLDPRNTAAHCGMGRALELLGRKDEAVRHFKQAIEIDPKCGPAKQGIERLQPASTP
jgi:tetratricopeptide (TPR) repeat protein